MTLYVARHEKHITIIIVFNYLVHEPCREKAFSWKPFIKAPDVK